MVDEGTEKKVLTCIIQDDISSFLLLYRKLAGTSYDIVGVHTAYDRKNQKFVIDRELTKLFPKIACLGPVPIYEDYVLMANFPYNIDLEFYKNNTVNIGIMEHLKTHHINDIYPLQKTEFHHKINIMKEEFEKGQKEINKDKLNIAINIFDPMYDRDITLQYDITYCLNTLAQEFPNKELNIHIVGLVHYGFARSIFSLLAETFEPFDFKVHNWLTRSFSEQLGMLLASDLLISGPYGWGFFAHTARIPSFIIYSFYTQSLMGKTIDPNADNHWYIESTDEDFFTDINKAVELIKNKV